MNYPCNFDLSGEWQLGIALGTVDIDFAGIPVPAKYRFSLRISLFSYMQSEAFRPAVRIDDADVGRLMRRLNKVMKQVQRIKQYAN